MFRNSATAAHDAEMRRDRGASAVEFALVVPILLLVVFGIINFGIVLAQKASLANAVRAGARYGSVNAYAADHTCRNVIDKVRSASTTVGISSSSNSKVGVTVWRVAPGGTKTSVCSGSGATYTGSLTMPPCKNVTADKTAPDSLSIDTTFDSKLLVPTPGLGTTFPIANSGSFQCEYN